MSSMDSDNNRDVPVEYLLFELALREGLGRKMADVAFGSKCCGNVPELPEELPKLDEIANYIKIFRVRIPKIVKRGLGLVSRAVAPAEELAPEVERLIDMTGELYKAHRTAIYRLREQYPEGYAVTETLEEYVAKMRPKEEESSTLGKLLSMVTGSKKNREPRPEPIKDIQIEVGNQYFTEFTSLVEKEMLLEYISTAFKVVRIASTLMQLPPEELKWIDRVFVKRGEVAAREKVEDLIYTYTSDSSLVSSFIETVVRLFDIKDPKIVEEGAAWLEGAVTYTVTALYED